MSDADRTEPTPTEPEPETTAEPTDDRPQESTMDDDTQRYDTQPLETKPLGTRTEDHDKPWEVADAPAAAPGPATAPRPVSTDVRVGTIVWGLVLAAVGVGFLALAAGLAFDVELAFIAIVALAGVGLVAGAIVTAARRGHRPGS